MTEFTFPPLSITGIPITGQTGCYPANRIFCVGRNYAAHAAEMGVAVDREKPFYFTKSPSSVILSGATAAYPPGTDNYHHEIELVVAMRAEAFQVDRAAARQAIWGYGVGLDMTRRDLQLSERAKQRPWSLGKDVEDSAVFAPLSPAAQFTVANQRIWLTVNGETRQEATLAELVWQVDEIVSHLSGFYHLRPGDLIMTGTPAGVGPVESGDVIEGGIDGLADISLTLGTPG